MAQYATPGRRLRRTPFAGSCNPAALDRQRRLVARPRGAGHGPGESARQWPRLQPTTGPAAASCQRSVAHVGTTGSVDLSLAQRSQRANVSNNTGRPMCWTRPAHRGRRPSRPALMELSQHLIKRTAQALAARPDQCPPDWTRPPTSKPHGRSVRPASATRTGQAKPRTSPQPEPTSSSRRSRNSVRQSAPASPAVVCHLAPDDSVPPDG
jgi:hypothetical protein